MNRRAPPPIFLQRASYRQRRVRDAARLLPFLGVILWGIPLTWIHGGGVEDAGTSGLIYVFTVWVVLIILTALLASRIKADDRSDDEVEGDKGP